MERRRFIGLLLAAGLLAGCSSGGGGANGFVPADFGLDKREPNPSCVAPPRQNASGTPLALQDAFPGLRFEEPLAALQAPGDSSRWFVVERTGRVHSVSAAGSSLFVDLRDRVDSSFLEAGLLGMAFHPAFAQNRQVFLSYTRTGSPFVSYISRFTTDPSGSGLDPASEQPILTVDQPFLNHNGGHIVFGPDGFLYIGLGDGGDSGDPLGNAQNTGTLLGKILRIDINAGTPYAIPPGNPFAAGGGRGEVFAFGLRNPWRFNFDRATGELWAGDVGQDLYEEIDRIVAGGNYGWNVREGMHCYNAATCATGFIEPVAEYGRDQGISVTGGYVYRGSHIPGLHGVYLYADYGSGRIWGLFPDAAGGLAPRELLDAAYRISSFAEGADGELYVVAFDAGQVFRIIPGSGALGGVAQRLSASGCVDPANPSQPAPGLIPYDINVPFWSDGADKSRFIALPDATTIHVNADGDWIFPIGTVLMKHFRLNGRLIETRLFMRHPDGEWGGYSYEWSDDQRDALLVPQGKTKVIDNQTWTYPSSAQCLICHTTAAGRALGPETAQMNRSFDYVATHRRANQLATLEHIGAFDAPLAASPTALPALPSPDAAQPVSSRARAYLHANCAYCHRPGGTTQSQMNLLFSAAHGEMNVCNVAPLQGNLGVANARLLAPGDPGHSLLALRMRTLETGRMPPLASSVRDDGGIGLIESWITSKASCP